MNENYEESHIFLSLYHAWGALAKKEEMQELQSLLREQLTIEQLARAQLKASELRENVQK